MRRSTLMLAVMGALVLLVTTAPVMTAYQGGVESSTQEYDCGGSCHTKASTATVSMVASKTSLTPSQALTVTVTVNGGQAEGILGVMLITTLSPVPESIPSAKGWGITVDPSGSTALNYFETLDYAGSGTYMWTLTAPTADGPYQLYARVMHGGGNQAYSVNDAAGISFIVGSSGLPTGPVVSIISPLASEKIHGAITISASIPSTTPIAYAVLTVDGIVRENKTAGPFTWSLDTQLLSDGKHTINITAGDAEGHRGYSQITVTVDNAAANILLLNWVWTMAAGSIAIIAAISVMMVVALLIRRRMMGGKT